MDLLFSLCGIGAILSAIVGYSVPVIRHEEDSVTDYDATKVVDSDT
jgi:hypothetical protein